MNSNFILGGSSQAGRQSGRLKHALTQIGLAAAALWIAKNGAESPLVGDSMPSYSTTEEQKAYCRLDALVRPLIVKGLTLALFASRLSPLIEKSCSLLLCHDSVRAMSGVDWPWLEVHDGVALRT
jgi:hypothetical protein